MEQLRNNGFDNGPNFKSIVVKLDVIIAIRIEEIFSKIKEIYSERELSPNYETYFKSQIALIQLIGEDQKISARLLLQQLCNLTNFLNEFEYSYYQFNELHAKFKNDQDKCSKLFAELVNSEIICGRKKTIEQQFEILNKDFKDFNPGVNFPQQLRLGLIQLYTKLNELSTLNKSELRTQQEQYAHLIDLFIDSKVNLSLHATIGEK